MTYFAAKFKYISKSNCFKIYYTRIINNLAPLLLYYSYNAYNILNLFLLKGIKLNYAKNYARINWNKK